MYGIQNGSNTIWLQLNAIILYVLPLLNDTTCSCVDDEWSMHPSGPGKQFHWPTKVDTCWSSNIVCH